MNGKKFKENEPFALYCATNVTLSRNGWLFGVHAHNFNSSHCNKATNQLDYV